MTRKITSAMCSWIPTRRRLSPTCGYAQPASATGASISCRPLNSEVVIAKIAEDDYILIAADQITSYRVSVGKNVLTVDSSGFSMGERGKQPEKYIIGHHQRDAAHLRAEGL